MSDGMNKNKRARVCKTQGVVLMLVHKSISTCADFSFSCKRAGI